ncbi:MAG TPA: hypothetical protein VG206_20680 [Terriglobia bacterium]|nr:hypothetical protein [Terriglobia bacterium]
MVLPRDKTARPSPEWLRSRWERKKWESAARVAAAVKALRGEGQAVTYASIRERVHALSGLWISANTIKRNELAYPIYMEHRQAATSKGGREPLLMRLLAAVPVGQRRVVQSKVARLRREPKDALIAKLILLDETVAKQKRAENTLREEIIRLHQAKT